MWRSVIVYNGEKLSLKDDWLIIEDNNGKSNKIPMDDLYCVVIDNRELLITVPVLASLAEHKVHLIITDDHHMPVSVTYPLNASYHSYRIIKKQLELSDDFKGSIWKIIIRQKILNQSICLENLWCDTEIVDRMHSLSDEVAIHDVGNREAIAAKLYFRNLFGSSFVRFEDDAVNNTLNYGYAIIRSGIAKSLVAHGFSCVVGIHHISETNPFNLADDFMEPLRPLVDEWVALNYQLLMEDLSKETKRELVNLLNDEVFFDGKTMKVRYAIDSMIKSYVTSIETNNFERCKVPEIIYHHEK